MRLIIILLLAVFSAFGEIIPATDGPPPLSPEESAETFHLAPGFSMELIASEPLITEPSGVCWDEHGRLFVSELHGYNVDGWHDIQELNKSGQLDTSIRRIRGTPEGRKKAAGETFGVIKMLRDKNGDGRMDDAIVWATNLPPVYGIIPAHGGLIAACAPEIVYLADKDGDGIPEIRETLFKGFSVGELERGINAPQWGVDNWIYFGAGWGGSTVSGLRLKKAVRLGHTDFRLKPDGSILEPVEGETGTFGHAMTLGGDRFFTETSRQARYAPPLPWRYLARNPDAAMPRLISDAAAENRTYPIAPVHPWRLKRSQNPRWVRFYGAEETTPQGFFTSACSPLIYRDVAWPAEFRGNLFVCDPAQNLVSRLRLEDDGPAYRARREPADEKSEFLAAADSWFRPMYLVHAPDGSVYIVDMYREFIEDFSAIPRFLQQQYNILNGRDRGRLWRLTHDRAPKPPAANMAKLKDAQLVPELASVHFWRRETARRLLIERNAKQATALIARFLERGIQPAVASDPISAEGLVNALHTLEGLGTIRGEHLLTALKHRSPDVKRQALRIADRQFQRAGEPVEQLLLTDRNGLGDDSRLLLQIALSLGQSRDARASTALASVARDHGSIRWMDAAVASSAHRREKEILAHLMADAGASSEIIELLSAAVANRGDFTEIGETKVIVAKAADQRQRELLTRILDAGLAEVRPEKLVALASFDPPSGKFLAAIEKEVPKFIAALNGPRDAARGRELFREHCATCHVAKGLGAAVGPNLDSEQQRAEETILRDILFPTETIRAGYETWQVRTTSGIEYHALLASESPTSLTFRLPAGQEVTVLRKKAAHSESHKVSLMPSSYAQALTPGEVADIIEFLRSN